MRHKYQLTIRTLFILVGLLCAFLGWRAHIARSFDLTIDWIDSVDGRLYYDWQQPRIEPSTWPLMDSLPIENEDYYDPRFEIVSNSMAEPIQSPLSWLFIDKLSHVKVLSIPISKCSSDFCDRLHLFPELESVSLWIDLQDKADAIKKLDELKTRFPSLQFRSVFPTQ